ncbi:MAG: DUF1330 domain-containing protein [Acetobacteraceae bacterium]|nr:DUF1330 domain-containing protein [Acetobacteraceae bacterium]
MPAYLIANINVTDPALFDTYRAQVPAVIAQYGGKYAVRGGAMEVVEGSSPFQRLVVLEFPTMAALKSFYHSPEYAPLTALRQKASTGDVILVEGYAP